MGSQTCIGPGWPLSQTQVRNGSYLHAPRRSQGAVEAAVRARLGWDVDGAFNDDNAAKQEVLFFRSPPAGQRQVEGGKRFSLVQASKQ